MGMPPFAIRPLRADETDLAAAICRRAMMTVPCFDGTLHTPQEDGAFWRDHVFPGCEIFGILVRDRLRGQAAMSPGWIHQFHIDPDVHGQGLGSALLTMVMTLLPDIQLWTFQANLGARRFYERHGFVAMEYTDGAGNEENEPDVRYRWVR
jgi:GNAT superfamily N-acetyltransferase